MKSLSKYLTWGGRIAAALVIGLSAPAAMAAVGTIVGSKHDFTTAASVAYKGVNPNNQICIYCHAPHNNVNVAGTLLWNHASSAATYTLYSSPTMNATTTQPNPVSKVCLSCHDGTVAVDSFGGAAGSAGAIIPAASKAMLGTDLSNDHPISMLYTAAVPDPDLFATTKVVTIGAATASTVGGLLFGTGATATVECSSCHDVHNSTRSTAVEAKLLKITSTGSAICLACHNK